MFTYLEYRELRKTALRKALELRSLPTPEGRAPTYGRFQLKSLQDGMLSLRRMSARG